jgi:hypothetical protein
MTIQIRTLVVALGAALPLVGFTLPALAATRATAAVQDEQHALDDLVGAQVDLTHHHDQSALNSAGNAETVLLNGRQAGDYNDPASLNAVERAHGDLITHHWQAGQQALRAAENDLALPRAG